MPENYLLERLEIEFGKSEFDWIHFTVKLGERSYPAYFTAVFDPIQNFRIWLEEIATGGRECRFHWEGEGPSFLFEFERMGRHLGKFRAGYLDEPDHIGGVVDRRQLLTALYRGFLSYAHSYKFIWINYDECEFWQLLTHATGMDYPALIEALADFEREKLVKLFSEAHPRMRLSINYSNEVRWGFYLSSEMGNRPRPDDWHKRGFPLHWTVPAGIDKWDRRAKLDLAELSVSRHVGDGRITGSLSTRLRSPLIDEFLSSTKWEPEVDPEKDDIDLVAWDDEIK